MKRIIYILLFISIMITTIVYSAFSTQLQISGDAIVRSDNDIRITNVKVLSQTNNAYETYNNKYTKDTTSMFATLPSNSSITYEVEINNKSNIDYVIANKNIISYTNNNIFYNFDDEYIVIYSQESSNFTITLTNNTQQNQETILVLKYIFDEIKSTFINGADFNVKIKLLSGNLNPTYYTDDVNINSIVRTNQLNISPDNNNLVSTNNSNVPIYAWYDNGILYYYTKAKYPYMNNNSHSMFRSLKNVKSIDLETIDTSFVDHMGWMFSDCDSLERLNLSNFNTNNVVSMQNMFVRCASLKELNLNSFNTSSVNNMGYMFHNCSSLTKIIFGNNFITNNVTTMYAMFYGCESLISLDLSKFNTINVENMYAMFDWCTNLISLDLSNFNMSSVTNVNFMLDNLNSLEKLKTPKIYPSNLIITLPKTLYDGNNNSYTTLDSTSPTQTWLRINN